MKILLTILFVFTCFFIFSQLNKTEDLDSLLSAKKQKADGFDFKQIATKMMGLSDISIFNKPKDTLNPKKFGKKILTDLKNSTGYIDLNYSYGLNTVFIDTTRTIGSIFTANGAFSTKIIGVPVNVSFNYSTLKVPLGANNYFRISLDKDQLVENKMKKVQNSLLNLEKQEKLFETRKSQLSGLMGYVEVYLDKLKRKGEKLALEMKNNLANKVKDSIRKRKELVIDSVHYQDSISNYSKNIGKIQRLDTIHNADYQKMIKNQLERSNKLKDSLLKIHDRLIKIKTKYDSLSEVFAKSKAKAIQYKNKLESIKKGNFLDSINKTSFLGSVKTLDIGLTYPKTTSMTTKNIPIKGVNTAFQFGNIYVSLASGLTLNNVMASTNLLQNKVKYSKNMFNNFDFQKILNNGWLTTLCTGYGTPEGSHAFLRFNYITNTGFLNKKQLTNTQTYDPSASFELDFRYLPTFIKGATIDLIYGKTSMNKFLDTSMNRKAFQSLFSNYQSNMLKAKYTQSIPLIRSDFSLSYRRIDPYANTTSIAILQPNNQTIEFKSKHRLISNLSIGLMYKFQETIKEVNGANSISLHMVGGDVTGHFKEYLTYSLFLNHVNYRMSSNALSPNSQAPSKGVNYLFGATLGANFKISQYRLNSTFMTSEYLVSDTVSISKFTQLGISQSIMNRKFKFILSYNYFYSKILGINSGTSVFGISFKYKLKKVKFDSGVKLALIQNQNKRKSIGAHIEAMWEINKFIDVGMRAERFINGNYYRSYYASAYNRFPFLLSIQTRFKLK